MPPSPTTRRGVLQAAGAAALLGVAGCQTTQQESDHATVAVPGDQPTIQAGVDAATAGDLVRVGPGTYTEAVAVDTDDVSIRGEDRNRVVLDGEFERSDGIDVEADGVAVENLTARHYTHSGVYWDDVEGFRGSYLTAYNSGGYGIYAARSRDGRFEHCYASGHGDAGFYLGRNNPFDALVTDVVAEYNALGYSGTSAGGNLTIRDSLWQHNGAGIVPHTLDRADPPQRESDVVDNVVRSNANRAVPFRGHTYPAFGTGIFVWGGSENTVARNVVSDHAVGIALQAHVVAPAENVVRGNLVRDSDLADLGLGEPVGEGNRFADNGFSSSLPEDLEGDATSGNPHVADRYERLLDRGQAGDYPENDWRAQPEPDPQPPMPDPDRPPQPVGRAGSARSGSARSESARSGSATPDTDG